MRARKLCKLDLGRSLLQPATIIAAERLARLSCRRPGPVRLWFARRRPSAQPRQQASRLTLTLSRRRADSLCPGVARVGLRMRAPAPGLRLAAARWRPPRASSPSPAPESIWRQANTRRPAPVCSGSAPHAARAHTWAGGRRPIRAANWRVRVSTSAPQRRPGRPDRWPAATQRTGPKGWRRIRGRRAFAHGCHPIWWPASRRRQAPWRRVGNTIDHYWRQAARQEQTNRLNGARGLAARRHPGPERERRQLGRDRISGSIMI